MRILDTHLHLIYPDRFSYPWLSGVPKLNRAWSVESYFAEAANLGIEHALHMEVDAAETDMVAETQFVTKLDPRVTGAIAAARPENGDFETHVEGLLQNPMVRGIRRILHQSPDELSQTERFRANLRRLGELGLSFDLCLLARQLWIARNLVDAAPDTRFILDHCGNPDVAGGTSVNWHDDIADLAKRPNLAVKISGIVTNARADWTVNDIRPYVEHLIASFGWDRVVWGSDHPVVTLASNLTGWVEASRELVRHESNDNQSKLFHRNAERIYRVEV
ncbi:MAG: amidohydrolase [Hyphomicrobiaceae bacterium]|nr:amidohydrolase [Hyphomicrobiaceae bacterium]